MKKHLGGKVLFLLFCLESTRGESQNPHKIHLPCPSLLMVPPGACHKPPPVLKSTNRSDIPQAQPECLRGSPYPPHALFPLISPRPALTHFFLFSSLKKPTGARKSPSQEEVARWLLRDCTREVVSVSCLFKSCNLLAESWSPTSCGPEHSQPRDE